MHLNSSISQTPPLLFIGGPRCPAFHNTGYHLASPHLDTEYFPAQESRWCVNRLCNDLPSAGFGTDFAESSFMHTAFCHFLLFGSSISYRKRNHEMCYFRQLTPGTTKNSKSVLQLLLSIATASFVGRHWCSHYTFISYRITPKSDLLVLTISQHVWKKLGPR